MKNKITVLIILHPKPRLNIKCIFVQHHVCHAHVIWRGEKGRQWRGGGGGGLHEQTKFDNTYIRESEPTTLSHS